MDAMIGTDVTVTSFFKGLFPPDAPELLFPHGELLQLTHWTLTITTSAEDMHEEALNERTHLYELVLTASSSSGPQTITFLRCDEKWKIETRKEPRFEDIPEVLREPLQRVVLSQFWDFGEPQLDLDSLTLFPLTRA